MPNYAEVKDNKVLRVVVINDDWSDERARQFLTSLSKNTWVKDDQSGIHVSKGHEHHGDFFSFPKPFDSWTLDRQRRMYIPPLPKPIAVPIGYVWQWSEQLRRWVQRTLSRND